VLLLLGEAELRELAEDVKKQKGLLDPIVLYKAKILDGRNRLAACKLAGIDPVYEWISDDDLGASRSPIDYVLSKNMHRRHLTNEQKRAVVAAVFKEQPGQTNRQAAAKTGTDHKTVGSVRKEPESRGEIPHVTTRADAKGRKQPARKATGEEREARDQRILSLRSRGFAIEDIASQVGVSLGVVKSVCSKAMREGRLTVKKRRSRHKEAYHEIEAMKQAKGQPTPEPAASSPQQQGSLFDRLAEPAPGAYPAAQAITPPVATPETAAPLPAASWRERLAAFRASCGRLDQLLTSQTGTIEGEALLDLFAAIDNGHEALSQLNEELWVTHVGVGAGPAGRK
jgi:hypothetical protein